MFAICSFGLLGAGPWGQHRIVILRRSRPAARPTLFVSPLSNFEQSGTRHSGIKAWLGRSIGPLPEREPQPPDLRNCARRADLLPSRRAHPGRLNRCRSCPDKTAPPNTSWRPPGSAYRFFSRSDRQCAVMTEKRKEPRQTLDYPCWLDLGPGRPPIECKITDVSKSGAKLTCDVPVADEFVLYLTRDGKVGRRCKVVRRDQAVIGLNFVSRNVPKPKWLEPVVAGPKSGLG